MPRRKTNEEWLRDVQDHVGDSYVFLQPYVNNKTKLACYHVDCGEIIYIRPDSITEGKGCNNCYGSHKRTQQQAKDDLYRVHRFTDRSWDEFTKAFHAINLVVDSGNELIKEAEAKAGEK